MNAAKGHALVTGGAIRIGRVIALTLAQAGWDVTIHYHTSAAQAQSLGKEIEAIGRRAFLVQADLADRTQTENLILSLQGPPLTSLVNNASLFEHDDKDPDGVLHNAINNVAPRLLGEALAKQLPEGQEGAIVHVLDSTHVHKNMSHYSASRAALFNDIPTLARSFAPCLRVNAVSPGPTLINPRQSQAHFDAHAAATPLGRASTPEDIAAGVLFLLENRSITGQILNIDAGMHLNSV